MLAKKGVCAVRRPPEAGGRLRLAVAVAGAGRGALRSSVPSALCGWVGCSLLDETGHCAHCFGLTIVDHYFIVSHGWHRLGSSHTPQPQGHGAVASRLLSASAQRGFLSRC